MNGLNERVFCIENIEQRERLLQFLAKRIPPFQIDLGPIRQQRTLSQNSRLWALHQLAAEHIGYSPAELHELMLFRHFGSKEIEAGGYKITVPLKRSSTREKKEFREFMDAVETFYASEFGIWLGASDEIDG